MGEPSYKSGANTTQVTDINSELLKTGNVLFAITGFQ